MRYLLILTLCLAACRKDKEESVSEVALADPTPAVQEASASAAAAGRATKVSKGAPAITEAAGWIGPTTSMSGAWKNELHNCIEVQTALPKATYEALSPEEQARVTKLHSELLTQWDRDKRFEADGCEAAFSDLPTLAECEFQVAMSVITPKLFSEPSKALVQKYTDEGAIRFRYQYYNPRTAIDEPLFAKQCKDLKGKWTSVTQDSDDYKTAVKLYADKAGRTGEDAPPVQAITFDKNGKMVE